MADNYNGRAEYRDLGGKLLVASPQLQDAHFRHAVVYVAQDDEEGVVGLIINRLLEVDLGTVWEQCPEEASEMKRCFFGGPVDQGRGLLVHRHQYWHGSNHFGAHLEIGGEDEDIVRALERDAHCPFRLYLGHSGWDYDQLQDELDRGFWRIHDGHPRMATQNANPPELWNQLISDGPRIPAPGVN